MCLYMLYSSLHMLYVCICTCMHAYYKACRRHPRQLPRQCRAEEVEEVAEAIRGPAPQLHGRNGGGKREVCDPQSCNNTNIRVTPNS